LRPLKYSKRVQGFFAWQDGAAAAIGHKQGNDNSQKKACRIIISVTQGIKPK
jgi:hypothetical protein